MKQNKKILKQLKVAIWIYFLLIIFEGAIRKWLLPGLSNPLLIIRDPIALYVIIVARANGYYSFNPYSFWMLLVTFIGVYTSMVFGHGNLMVAFYGARIFLIHFPMIFSIGRILNHDDILKIGRVNLWIILPTTLLIILQFYSPQSAWVNRGVGNDINGAGFSGALGYFRPPGFFSFTNGNSLHYGLAAAYLFYFWFHTESISKFLLVASTVCILLSMPFSISRTVLFETALSLCFMIIALWKDPVYLKRIFFGVVIVYIAFSIFKNLSFVDTGVDAFTARFETANEGEGGLNGVFFDRFIGGMIGAVKNAPNLPFYGYGIGMGTNVASVIISGQRGFLVAEEEWARIIGELGLLLGFIIIFVRVSLSISLAVKSIKELRMGNNLPWMLLSFGFIQVWEGGWAQPTSLGFATISGGFILAAINNKWSSETEEETTENEVVPEDELTHT